jgi:hypothetical protein
VPINAFDLLAGAHERHEQRDEDHQRQHDPGARPDHARADTRDACDRGERRGARDQHRPGPRRRRDRDERDPGQAGDLRARVEAVHTAGRIAGHPGLV